VSEAQNAGDGKYNIASRRKFTKTDPTKFEHTWDQKPHTVSRRAEKNFVAFMAELSGQRPAVPDDQGMMLSGV